MKRINPIDILYAKIMLDNNIVEHYKNITKGFHEIELELEDKYITIDNQWTSDTSIFYLFIDDKNINNENQLAYIIDLRENQVLELLPKIK